MTFTETKARELAYQKKTLQAEFYEWQRLSNEKQPLEKHNTQIRRIVHRLEAFMDAIPLPNGAASSYQSNQKAQDYLLGVHLLWNYFRSKLAMRGVAWLKGDLDCADEFAWECYQPALTKAQEAKKIAEGELKEPPLVFFSSEASPFAQSRDSHFKPEGITSRTILNFGEAIFSLPIPVIGVPWFQLSQVHGAVVIAHEVGHTVERDFHLEDDVKKLIESAVIDAAHRPAWLAWQHEVFADVYGTLCCGPAYLIGLMSYLAVDVDFVRQQKALPEDWGTYPPHFLRMALINEVISQIGLSAAASARLSELGAAEPDPMQSWRSVYKVHQMTAYENDLEPLVKALLDGLYPMLGNIPLKAVVNFEESELNRSAALAYYLLEGSNPGKGEKFRHMVAAAVLAYYARPEEYEKMNAKEPINQRFYQTILEGIRAGNEQFSPQRENEIDQTEGLKLFAYFQEQP